MQHILPHRLMFFTRLSELDIILEAVAYSHISANEVLYNPTG